MAERAGAAQTDEPPLWLTARVVTLHNTELAWDTQNYGLSGPMSTNNNEEQQENCTGGVRKLAV